MYYLCYNYLNTATNHQPYLGRHSTFTGGGGTAPCAPPPALVTALKSLVGLYSYYSMYLKWVIVRAVASVGPGGARPPPPDKVLAPPGWPGAVYGEF